MTQPCNELTSWITLSITVITVTPLSSVTAVNPPVWNEPPRCHFIDFQGSDWQTADAAEITKYYNRHLNIQCCTSETMTTTDNFPKLACDINKITNKATGQSPWEQDWLKPRLYVGSVYHERAAEAAYAAIMNLTSIATCGKTTSKKETSGEATSTLCCGHYTKPMALEITDVY